MDRRFFWKRKKITGEIVINKFQKQNMEIPKVVITRRRTEIKPEEALHPHDRMNKKGYDIEVSTRSKYECFNITDAKYKIRYGCWCINCVGG